MPINEEKLKPDTVKAVEKENTDGSNTAKLHTRQKSKESIKPPVPKQKIRPKRLKLMDSEKFFTQKSTKSSKLN